jgi:hypothetical protein
VAVVKAAAAQRPPGRPNSNGTAPGVDLALGPARQVGQRAGLPGRPRPQRPPGKLTIYSATRWNSIRPQRNSQPHRVVGQRTSVRPSRSPAAYERNGPHQRAVHAPCTPRPHSPTRRRTRTTTHQPIRIAGQPIAEEGQQLAQLDRIASIEAQKKGPIPGCTTQAEPNRLRQPGEHLHPGAPR